MARYEDRFFTEMEKLYYWMGFRLFAGGSRRTVFQYFRQFVFMHVVCMTPVQLIIECLISRSLVSITESLLPAITIFNSGAKYVAIFFRQKEVMATFGNMKELVKNQQDVSWKREIMDSGRKRVEAIQKIFLINFGISASAALVNSAVFKAMYPDKTTFPLKMWFPFDTSTTQGYIAVFFYETFTTSTGTVIFTFTYMTFAGLVIHVSSQIKILSEDLRNIFHSQNYIGDMRSCKDDVMRRKLAHAVEHHVRIIRLVQSINKILGNTLFLEIVLSSLQSCLVVFQISKTPLNHPRMLFLVPFFLTTTFMPVSICWCGQLLKTNSQRLFEAVYESKWYDVSPAIRTDLIFILRQTNIPLTLSAKNTFHMDLATFLRTLQTAYSYLAMLRTVDL